MKDYDKKINDQIDKQLIGLVTIIYGEIINSSIKNTVTVRSYEGEDIELYLTRVKWMCLTSHFLAEARHNKKYAFTVEYTDTKVYCLDYQPIEPNIYDQMIKHGIIGKGVKNG